MVGYSSYKQLPQEAIFDITYNDLSLDLIADSKENIIQELKEYEQNKNYTTNIVDTVIVALATITKATIVAYYQYKEMVKNYIFKPLSSESKTIIELVFINRHYDLIVYKTELPVTTEQKLFDTDVPLKSVSNSVASNLEDSCVEAVGSNDDNIASIEC